MKNLLFYLLLLLSPAVSYAAPDFYLVGKNNNWDHKDEFKFTESNGTYTLHLDSFNADDYYAGYKIATRDWKQQYGIDGEMALFVPLTLAHYTDGHNIYFPEEGNISQIAGATLVFDYTGINIADGDYSNAHPKLTIYPDFYIAGSWIGDFTNNTNSDYRLTMVKDKENVFRGKVPYIYQRFDNKTCGFKLVAGIHGNWNWQYGDPTGMETGKPYSVRMNGSDMSVAEDLVNVTVTLDLNNMTVLLEKDYDYVDKDVYLAGAINGWEATEAAYKFTQGPNGIFSLYLPSLTGEFKIVYDVWGTQYGCEVSQLELGQIYSLIKAGNGYNMELAKADKITDVTLRFDYYAETLEVDGTLNDVPGLYLVGDLNNWEKSPGYAFTYDADNNKYVLTTHNFSGKFRVVSDDSAYNFGGGDISLSQETSIKHSGESDMTFSGVQTSGLGRVKITVTPISGMPTTINKIESDDADSAIEYYNLQGIRVIKPERGVYIRRIGSKSEKVIIR